MPDLSKLFKAYDVRQTYPEPLNEDAGWRIGFGTGMFFSELNGGKPGRVLVTRDHRPAAPSMAKALIDGLRATGCDVVDLGMADTSFLYFAIPHVDNAIGGVQCTASHNPVEYIGYKISGPGAKPIGKDTGLQRIREIAEATEDTCPEPVGQLTEMDLWDEYREHVLSFLTPLSRPMKVFVDAANGMATTLVPKVFQGVENLELIEINNEYTTPWAHEPNPLVAENVVPTQDGVAQHSADLGAAFDGDADRCMIVDDAGEIIGCDHMTAWLADHFLEQGIGDTIVYDLRSSKAVAERVTEVGGKTAMSKVGHVNMKALLREVDGPFGGELSGHFYFKRNSYADSGAITLASVLSVLGQTPEGTKLSDLIAPYRKYPQSGEINFENDDKQGTMDALKADFGDGADEVLELDGVSVDRWSTDGYWFNVRASNTEPLLRLNAEAKDQATLDALLEKLTPRMGTVHAGH